MKRFPLSELVDGWTRVRARDDVEVTGIANHSADVQRGDLYIALAGERYHGMDFVSDAIARGAGAVVWDDYEISDRRFAIPVIRVPNLRERMGLLADRFFAHPSAALTVIAVTGTNGKSSVSHFIAEGLSLAGHACGLIGTLGYGCFGDLRASTHTTPDALTVHKLIHELKQKGVRNIVIEASSHGLAQGRLNGVAIDIAVFTNLGHDHQDYHASYAEYVRAKRKLFESHSLKVAVINYDDKYATTMIGACSQRTTVLTYSKTSREAMVYLLKAAHRERGLALSIAIGNKTVAAETRLIGYFNSDNLMAAMLVLMNCGVLCDEVGVLFSAIHPVDGRMQRFGDALTPTVFLDYAHTPEALEEALLAARDYAAADVVCVFGCGGERDTIKRPLMGKVATRYAQRVVLCDDNPREEDPQRICDHIRAGVQTSTACCVLHDRRQAIMQAVSAATPRDAVLVAGKGHERYQIVGTVSKPFSDAEVIKEVLEDYQWHG